MQWDKKVNPYKNILKDFDSNLLTINSKLYKHHFSHETNLILIKLNFDFPHI